MSKEKQIESLIHEIRLGVMKGGIGWRTAQIAEQLYDAGYRKQSEPISCGHEKGGEWISVDERLPDIDPRGKGRYGGARSVRVLCACKQRDGRTFVKEGYYEPCGNGNVFWRIPGSIDSVTHWMPLPEPPNRKNADQYPAKDLKGET